MTSTSPLTPNRRAPLRVTSGAVATSFSPGELILPAAPLRPDRDPVQAQVRSRRSAGGAS